MKTRDQPDESGAARSNPKRMIESVFIYFPQPRHWSEARVDVWKVWKQYKALLLKCQFC